MIHAMKLLEKIAYNVRRRIAQLQCDERGVSAVEFALLLPLMVTLYLGSVEISQAISADRKVTMTSRTVADLISQVSSINNAGMTDVLSASSSVMSPFTTTTLKVTVTSVSVDANGKATVDWSDTLGGTARTKGSTVTLPSALNIANTSLIWSEVSYVYTPAVGYLITGSLTLKDQLYMAPRISNTVARTAT
jgi:Flp pilus assembly protein TadG